MKTYRVLSFVLAFLAVCGCEGWLREDGPMTIKVADYFRSEASARQCVNAAYAPLMWEYQGTYYSEFFIGDVASDDALKGGQNISDMAAAYDLDNFRTMDNNELLLQYYRAQYQGIGRANLAIEQIPAMETGEDFTESRRDRYVAEARFLRAFYYFRLVRLFGGVPLVTEPTYSSDGWIVPRSDAAAVYSLIDDDLAYAAEHLPKKSAYAPEDLGRATSGAAQAMLLKSKLYQHKYAEAVECGRKFILEQSGEYSLCPDYADNFTLDGENGPESVFEIQYMLDETSDYGEGNGFTRGTFATILTRGRSSAFGNAGWGFNHPTMSLYNEYEEGDARREATIIMQQDSEIVNPAEDIYLGNRLLCHKRVLFDDATRTYPALDHDSRSPINCIQIRLADVFLMYAEACVEEHDTDTAKDMLEHVRSRARAGHDILPEFPYGKYSDTEADLRSAIRHERRVELGMEGHRWFDICRWGVAKEVMDAYKAGESEEVRAVMSDFIEGKHELMPIPYEEVRLGKLEQNPNY